MNPSNKEKIEELKNDLMENPFTQENQQSRNNSFNNFKYKSTDFIYKNESSDSKPKMQYHNIYFALLYLISVFIVAISCAYYFSYNNYNNRIFLNNNKEILSDLNPFYKIVSKYTKGNQIFIKLQLEESSINNNNNYENIENKNIEQIKDLEAIFEFFYDSVNFKIYPQKAKSNLEEEKIYNIDYSNSNKKINYYKDSNINITFSHYPFNFYLQRKDDGAILFDSDCSSSSSQNQLFYTKNNIQICTQADEESYFFGLGDDMINRGLNLLIGKGQKFNLYSNNSDIMPFILSYNKYNLTSYGILMLNSGPIRVKMMMNHIIMNFLSGIINIHVFGGPSVKQVILQSQNTLGLSMIPYYSCIDWDFFEKNTNNIFINNKINLDDIYYKNISLNNFFNYENSNYTKNKEEDNNDKIYITFLDSFIYSKDFDDQNYFNLLFLHKDNEKLIKNDYLLNNLNTIGLQESKFYNNYISQILPPKRRVMLFSTRAFIDSNTLAYKLFNDIPFTLEGIRIAMRKFKSQSLFGNSFCYIKFEEESYIQNKNNEEIVFRWAQFLSLLPFASINLNNLSVEPIPFFTKNIRYIFNLYIYLYFLTISTEGGTYFRPLFYDLKSKKINEDLISKRYEIMLGSNILIEPIFLENISNITILFSEDKFYDFYTGNYINNKGEGYYDFICEKDKLPIFLRGGKITPVQLLDEYYDLYINNNMFNNKNNYNFYNDEILSMEKMKEKPIQLLIALDNNMQAQGRILLDDFNTNDSKKKKYFYKMLITVSQRTTDISIFFRVYTFKYNLPNNLFQNSINRLIIYGFTKLSIKKITIMNKNGRIEFDRSKLIFSQTSDVLTIPNINVPLNMDTKILII